MKDLKFYSGIIMFIIGASILFGILLHCINKEVNRNDNNITFVTYRAVNMLNKPEPVYIDTTDGSFYQIGDTIEVNKNGVVPAYYKSMPLRDAETKQLIYPSDWHWVVLQKRVGTKTFTRDKAEEQQ